MWLRWAAAHPSRAAAALHRPPPLQPSPALLSVCPALQPCDQRRQVVGAQGERAGVHRTCTTPLLRCPAADRPPWCRAAPPACARSGCMWGTTPRQGRPLRTSCRRLRCGVACCVAARRSARLRRGGGMRARPAPATSRKKQIKVVTFLLHPTHRLMSTTLTARIATPPASRGPATVRCRRCSCHCCRRRRPIVLCSPRLSRLLRHRLLPADECTKNPVSLLCRCSAAAALAPPAPPRCGRLQHWPHARLYSPSRST